MNRLNKAFIIAEYIQKYLRNEIKTNELVQLNKWISESEENEKLFEELKNGTLMNQQMAKLKTIDVEAALEKFRENKRTHEKVISIEMKRRKRWMEAVASIILISGLSYFLIHHFGNKNEAVNHIVKKEVLKNDIVPGGNKAVLVLADGSSINLNNVDNGSLARQGNISVIKLAGGRLIYKKNGIKNNQVQFNKITTPRGGQYYVELSDGTKVWLNAASSITYPVSFVGDQRNVEITGEVYFKVSHDPSRPFHVKVKDMDIRVLGTQFNVCAYEDDEAISTTLIHGSVKIFADNESVMLEPGEQAKKQNGYKKFRVLKDVDIESVVAWKNGKFIFNEEDIHQIMRKLERWYDISVTYQTNTSNEKFVGVISRNVGLSQVLGMLEKTGVVSFTVVGKNIIVK